MIPKIIHYCWFGGNPIPEFSQKCIASWKKYCPEYEIKEWNDNNYNVHKMKYIDEAYNAGKYAFASDYARFDIIYQYGGIFLDVDVEIIKPFNNNLLKNNSFGGFEDAKYVNPGSIFAGEKGCALARELMEFYGTYNFIKKRGKLNLTPSPRIFTDILLKYGLTQKNTYQELGIFTAYPSDYFCPKDFNTGKLSTTKNTYSIHHYDSSWYSKEENNKKHERWDFCEKYGGDNYLVDLYNKKALYENRAKNYDIEYISLKKAYKLVIKKTIIKIFGESLFNKIHKNI
jgi:mannosyltransferase OCH1-like enzyme